MGDGLSAGYGPALHGALRALYKYVQLTSQQSTRLLSLRMQRTANKNVNFKMFYRLKRCFAGLSSDQWAQFDFIIVRRWRKLAMLGDSHPRAKRPPGSLCLFSLFDSSIGIPQLITKYSFYKCINQYRESISSYIENRRRKYFSKELIARFEMDL